MKLRFGGLGLDSNTKYREGPCLARLECIQEIFRSLIMGSCFSNETMSPLPGSLMGVMKSKGSKSRLRSPNPSFGRDEQLRKTPGRIFLNGSSEVVSLFARKAKNEPIKIPCLFGGLASSFFALM